MVERTKRTEKREANIKEDTRRAAFTSIYQEPLLELDTDPSTECQNGQGNTGYSLFYSKQNSSTSWIIDSSTSDHMTFDLRDL